MKGFANALQILTGALVWLCLSCARGQLKEFQARTEVAVKLVASSVREKFRNRDKVMHGCPACSFHSCGYNFGSNAECSGWEVAETGCEDDRCPQLKVGQF